MAEPRYACRTCGTWTCARCGWKRPGASITYLNHTCGHCPSLEGSITPTMHTGRMWWLHNDEIELPKPYVYGERPAEGATATTAATGPEFYRGVRVPVTGPYARIDITSWKQGVDDALG